MSIGIYKYENKLNGKVYIGLSDNIERRYEQHIYDANHIETRSGTGVDYAIAKYGIQNFTFEIVEICSLDKLDEREIYWIEYYNSYKNGYNRTPGGRTLRGENHPRAILTEKDVWDIREEYAKGTPRRKVFEKYIIQGITERSLLKVWNNENWVDVHSDVYTEENKQKHKNNYGHSEDQINLSSLDRASKQDEIDIWVQEYKNGMTINAISKKYNKDFGTIQKYINKPQAITKVKYGGRKLQNVETQQVFKSISAAARWAGCGSTTLTRHLTTDKAAGRVPGTEDVAHWIELP